MSVSCYHTAVVESSLEVWRAIHFISDLVCPGTGPVLSKELEKLNLNIETPHADLNRWNSLKHTKLLGVVLPVFITKSLCDPISSENVGLYFRSMPRTLSGHVLEGCETWH